MAKPTGGEACAMDALTGVDRLRYNDARAAGAEDRRMGLYHPYGPYGLANVADSVWQAGYQAGYQAEADAARRLEAPRAPKGKGADLSNPGAR